MIYDLGALRVQTVGDEFFVAPSAAVIGRVQLGRDASVWFGAVLRGDSNDIRIGKTNQTVIKKMRCVVRAKSMTDPDRQVGMMQSARAACDRLEAIGITAYAYGDNFLLYDNFLTAWPTTLYYAGITLGMTLVVAFFMIPHPVAVFWVGIFVATALVGRWAAVFLQALGGGWWNRDGNKH